MDTGQSLVTRLGGNDGIRLVREGIRGIGAAQEALNIVPREREAIKMWRKFTMKAVTNEVIALVPPVTMLIARNSIEPA